MAAGQTPARPRPVAARDLVQRLRAPMRHQPGFGAGMPRPELQELGRDRQQDEQIQRTGPAVAQQGQRLRVARFDPRPELPRQDPAAFHRQAALVHRLRHRQVKNILLDRGIVERPGHHPGTARRGGKMLEVLAGPVSVNSWYSQSVAAASAAGRRPAAGRYFVRARSAAVAAGAAGRCRLPWIAQHGHKSSNPAGLSATSPARCT